MKIARLLAVLTLLPVVSFAAERLLKADPARSYVEADVKVTVGDFTARLESYDLTGRIDDKNRIKSATFAFKFANLKTGKADRDQDMLTWLGGDDVAGRFELGILAVTPDGQGQVTGNLFINNKASLVEFPVNVTHVGGVYTITGQATVDYRHWGLKVIRRAGLIKVDPYVKIRFKFIGTAVDAPPATPLR